MFVDGGLKVRHRAKDATLQAAFGERGEESFDGVDPRTRGRRKVTFLRLSGHRIIKRLGALPVREGYTRGQNGAADDCIIRP